MKFYRVKYYALLPEEWIVNWFGNKRDAEKLQHTLLKNDEVENISVKCIITPRNKSNLIYFLNEHARIG